MLLDIHVQSFVRFKKNYDFPEPLISPFDFKVGSGEIIAVLSDDEEVKLDFLRIIAGIFDKKSDDYLLLKNDKIKKEADIDNRLEKEVSITDLSELIKEQKPKIVVFREFSQTPTIKDFKTFAGNFSKNKNTAIVFGSNKVVESMLLADRIYLISKNPNAYIVEYEHNIKVYDFKLNDYNQENPKINRRLADNNSFLNTNFEKYSEIEERFIKQNTDLEDLNISFKKQLFIQVKNKSKRAAISSIMSRNMSHNLGSHVFYHTREDIKMLLEKLTTETSEIENTKKKLKGITWFLGYMQERQDFIANINSNDTYPFGPLNLKQDITDELTPDGVDRRHGSQLITENFILKYIVKSEKVSRKLRRCGKETNYDSSKKFPYYNIEIQTKLTNSDEVYITLDTEKDLDSFYELNLATNGGQLSRHAFLTILENIIRNSAKHGITNKEEFDELLITIELEGIVSEKEKGVGDEVYENLNNDGPDEYKIKIYDNLGSANTTDISGKTTLEIMQEKLNALKMIDGTTFELDRNNKGIKEILAAVMWMKGIPLENIEDPESRVLSIEEHNQNLAYVFKLPAYRNSVEIKSKSEINNLMQDYKTEKFGKFFIINKELWQELDESEQSRINKMIPRLLVLGQNDSINKLWEMYMLEKHNVIQSEYYPICFEYIDKYLIKWDKAKIRILIEKEDDVVNIKNSAPIVWFKYHLSKNVEELEKSRNIFCENIRNKKSHETISGANQVFNLIMKLKKLKDDKEDIEAKKIKLQSLYWNIIEAYNTKIVIVDERLSFEQVKNEECNIKELFYKQQNTYVYNINMDSLLFTDSKNGIGCSKSQLLDNNEQEPSKELIDYFTIHVSLLEKIKEYQSKKDKNGQDAISNQSTNEQYIPSHQDLISAILKINNIEVKFICLHTGRGSLNAGDNQFTLIAFSTLQRCLEDSKYALSELFNSTFYKNN